MGERQICILEARGSIPLSSTKFKKRYFVVLLAEQNTEEMGITPRDFDNLDIEIKIALGIL